MRKIWLAFSQAVTLCVAALFVVATFRPQWWNPGPSFRVAPVNSERSSEGLSAAAQAAMPAVASVTAARQGAGNPHAHLPSLRDLLDDEEAIEGSGSAVLVSPEGYLLTNHHVIEGADRITVRLADGREDTATLVGTDPETDLAVLKIGLPRLPVATLGRSQDLVVGDSVLAIGHPFNVGLTATRGIVSALSRRGLGLSTFEDFIQTDAAINPGNSGGALVDARGALVGINTAIYSRSGGSLGIGFAVPIDLARQVMDELIRQGRVVRGWLGVEPRTLDADLARSLKLTPGQGVLLSGVLQGAPAHLAGLQPGDVLLEVDGRAVNSAEALLRLAASLKPGQRVHLKIQRQGQQMDKELTAGERPAKTK